MVLEWQGRNFRREPIQTFEEHDSEGGAKGYKRPERPGRSTVD